ncbi:uncharacterized protein F4807DRAFT_471205 [Annulohypoxylon truncatum]|uniref:uncharacterized protein n=1 Tax=Annulohypoxylon truncatum TaxID=327061 RepID=UPI002008A387|nr:uncharacterized protein F4807DRAFT_471205 [Annulohypoxylon truncatum]KAI1205186.1 hypothetical protein F4807DRAFT_471205 [Annulohypoxylon truncatum]
MGVKGRFDPSKPIDDPTVWYPHPNLWVKLDTSSKVRSGDGDNNDLKDCAFALDSADFAKLNRYVWTAKLLPTNRNDYMCYNSIPSNNELPKEVWDAADGVLATYALMQKEADTFLDDTWKDLVSISNKIFNYAMNAGGRIDSSYYRQLLIWVGDYNKENEKDKPDYDKLKEIQNSILAVTKSEMNNANKLQSETDTAKGALKSFHDACVGHQSNLEGSSGTLQNLLTGQNGIIKDLTKEIEEQMKEVANLQAQLEADRKKIRDAGYYVWIPLWGTIAGIAVAVLSEKDIERLRKILERVQDLIWSDQDKLRSAKIISSDLIGMQTSVQELVKCIQPALSTLEKIQGAWSAMSGDLEGLHDLFKNNLDSIPPLVLEELQLKKIVEHWNQLKDDVDIFRKNMYMTTMPPRDTIQGFQDKLGSVGN